MSDHQIRKQTHRASIAKTVERAIPQLEIDTTRVMSDDEMAELQRQTEERLASQKLAAEVGRSGLRARLKATMAKTELMLKPDGPTQT